MKTQLPPPFRSFLRTLGISWSSPRLLAQPHKLGGTLELTLLTGEKAEPAIPYAIHILTLDADRRYLLDSLIPLQVEPPLHHESVPQLLAVLRHHLQRDGRPQVVLADHPDCDDLISELARNPRFRRVGVHRVPTSPDRAEVLAALRRIAAQCSSVEV